MFKRFMNFFLILNEKREDLSLVHGLKTVAREGRTPVVEEHPRAENTEKRPKLQLQSYFFFFLVYVAKT